MRDPDDQSPLSKKWTGPSAVTLLAVLFIGLKLTGYIEWDWKWVLAPIWVSVAAAMILILGVLAFIFIVESWNARNEKKNDR